MNVRRIILTLVIIAVVGGGGYFIYQQFLAPESESAETAASETAADLTVDPSIDFISAEGQIVPWRHANLAFQTSGIVADILVASGDTIQAGDPLLRLEASDQELALQQALAGLTQAEANLETANAGLLSAQTNVSAAELAVTAAEVQLALVQAEPTAAQVAVSESGIALAAAGIEMAAGNRDVILEGASVAQIRAAEAQVLVAQAQLKPVEDAAGAFFRAEINDEDAEERIRIQLNAAQANLNAAQAALDELSAGATNSERLAASAAVTAATAERDAAQSQLDLLLAGPKAEQITIAEAGVNQALAAVAEAQLAVTQAETAVSLAETGVTQAQAAVDSAQAALDRMTLTAPFAGSVADLSVDLGEVIAPGVPVVVLADINQWVVETTDLTELDVVSVAIGSPVEVRVDAIPDEVLSGTVTEISPVSALTRGDVTYAVTIQLDNASNLPLRWGMTVFVDVDVDEAGG